MAKKIEKVAEDIADAGNKLADRVVGSLKKSSDSPVAPRDSLLVSEKLAVRQLIYEAAMCKRELNFVFEHLSAEQREEMLRVLLNLRLELQAIRGSRHVTL